MPKDAADVSKDRSSVSIEGADTWGRRPTSVEPLLDPADATKLVAVGQRHGGGWEFAMLLRACKSYDSRLGSDADAAAKQRGVRMDVLW